MGSGVTILIWMVVPHLSLLRGVEVARKVVVEGCEVIDTATDERVGVDDEILVELDAETGRLELTTVWEDVGFAEVLEGGFEDSEVDCCDSLGVDEVDWDRVVAASLEACELVTVVLGTALSSRCFLLVMIDGAAVAKDVVLISLVFEAVIRTLVF